MNILKSLLSYSGILLVVIILIPLFTLQLLCDAAHFTSKKHSSK